MALPLGESSGPGRAEVAPPQDLECSHRKCIRQHLRLGSSCGRRRGRMRSAAGARDSGQRPFRRSTRWRACRTGSTGTGRPTAERPWKTGSTRRWNRTPLERERCGCRRPLPNDVEFRALVTREVGARGVRHRSMPGRCRAESDGRCGRPGSVKSQRSCGRLARLGVRLAGVCAGRRFAGCCGMPPMRSARGRLRSVPFTRLDVSTPAQSVESTVQLSRRAPARVVVANAASARSSTTSQTWPERWHRAVRGAQVDGAEQNSVVQAERVDAA